MQLRRIIVLVISILGCQCLLHAQKWQPQLGVGAFYVPGSTSLNDIGQSKDIFGGFSPGWQLGGGILRNLRPAWQAGPYMSFGEANKSHYQLRNLQVGIKVCYTPFRQFDKLQPYLFAFPFYSFAYLNRSGYENQVVLQGSSSSGQPEAFVHSVDYTHSNLQTGGSNVGIMPGIGIKGTLKGKWDYFFNLGYAFTSLALRADFKNNYSSSNASFGYISLMGGVGYTIGKKKKNPKEKQKDVLAAASKKHPAHQSPKEDKTGGLKKLGYLKKEDFDPKKQFNVTGQFENSGITENTDKTILITDLYGKEIARTQADAKGNFRFANLKPDNYLIAQPDKTSSLKAKYVVSQDDMQLKGNTGKFPTGKLKGYLLEPLTNKPLTNTKVMLIDNKDGTIMEATTDKDGRFSYKGLPSSDFTVAIGSDKKPVKAKMYTLPEESAPLVTAEDFKKYNFQKLPPDHAFHKSGGMMLVGNVLSTPADNNSLMLVDGQGKVVESAVSGKNGYFTFHNLNADNYTVVSENSAGDVKVQAKLVPAIPELMLKGEKMLKYNHHTLKHEPFGASDKIVVIGNIGKAEGLPSNDETTMLLLDNKGNVVGSTLADKRGNFAFTHLPVGDYQIIAENSNPLVNPKVQVYEDNIQLKVSSARFPTGKLKGYLLEPMSNKPLTNTKVTLIDNEDGTILELITDNDGSFSYLRLSNSDLSVVIGDNTKPVLANMYTQVDGSSPMISMEDFKQYNFQKLSQDQEFQKAGGMMLIGKVVSMPPDDNRLLLLDSKGKVVGVVVSGKDGNFTYRNLPPDNYTVVPENSANEVKVVTNLVSAVPELVLKSSEMQKYNYQTLKYEPVGSKDRIMVLGSIANAQDLPLKDDITMILLDGKGNEFRRTLADRNGNFSFSHLPVGDYQIIPEKTMPNLNPRLQVYEDKSLLDQGGAEFGGKVVKSSYYGPNEYKLKPDQTAELDELVKKLTANPNIKKISLNGYGDMTGSPEYNMDLTRKRTEEIRKYLISKGIDPNKIQLNPMGRSMKYKNTQEKYEANLNRRVDVEIEE